MNPSWVYVVGLIFGIVSWCLTFFLAWLLRRDAKGGQSAVETTRVGELERRITLLEANAVSRHDLDALFQRLDLMQTDIRDIRNYQVSHAAANMVRQA